MSSAELVEFGVTHYIIYIILANIVIVNPRSGKMSCLTNTLTDDLHLFHVDRSCDLTVFC